MRQVRCTREDDPAASSFDETHFTALSRTDKKKSRELEHAESIFVALELLDKAHQKGLLPLAEGAISSKDTVFAKVTEYAKQPQCTKALRNLLTVGELVGSIDPERLESIVKDAADTSKKPPPFFRLLTRSGKQDVRRGLNTALELLSILGSVSH